MSRVPVTALRRDRIELDAVVIVPASHMKAIREHVLADQAAHWQGLFEQLHQAANASWSMGCESEARSIAAAASLVGACSPDTIPWELVSGGVYETLLEAVGLQCHPDFTPELIAKQDALFYQEAIGLTGVAAQNRYLRTCRYIRQVDDWWDGE